MSVDFINWWAETDEDFVPFIVLDVTYRKFGQFRNFRKELTVILLNFEVSISWH